ncbi:unnamed protein product [Prunus brigantina]
MELRDLKFCGGFGVSGELGKIDGSIGEEGRVDSEGGFVKSMCDEVVNSDGFVEFGDGGFVDFGDGEADSEGGFVDFGDGDEEGFAGEGVYGLNGEEIAWGVVLCGNEPGGLDEVVDGDGLWGVLFGRESGI